MIPSDMEYVMISPDGRVYRATLRNGIDSGCKMCSEVIKNMCVCNKDNSFERSCLKLRNAIRSEDKEAISWEEIT